MTDGPQSGVSVFTQLGRGRTAEPFDDALDVRIDAFLAKARGLQRWRIARSVDVRKPHWLAPRREGDSTDYLTSSLFVVLAVGQPPPGTAQPWFVAV